ncbi:ferredoxin--NADP(+) reductase [Buchnera aphidicola (Hormaphis cornu)]|nr:ferredoxin--NADP(+) reductase [Buchnera aphidicola (Hormaphis cornu)]
MTNWVTATVKTTKKWSDNLFSLILKAPIAPFTAGQFTKIAMKNKHGKYIQRAYSYVNSPNDSNLEFYIILIPGGKFTTTLYHLKPYDTLLISQNAFGYFTLKEIPNSEILWMFATGTAIGPYCSILQENKDIKRFNKIVLIHAVRYARELNYLPLFKKMQKVYKENLKIVTIVSREHHSKSLFGRIPDLIKNNLIEKQTGLNLEISTSHIMLCGNPNMVKDTLRLLQITRNMQKHLRRKSGHITTENYW